MIRSETDAGVAVVRIDRPRHRNALDLEHCEELGRAVRDAVDGGARCVVITGEGSAFCAGADLNQVYGEAFKDALYRLLRLITEVPPPVLAAVNGPAIGAGTQLAIACDLRVAAPDAAFGIPTARLGLAVDPWTVHRLASLAGGGVARSILVGAATIPADRAYHHGLVDRLGDLADAIGWATEIAGLAPLTLAYSKLALNTPDASDPSLERAFHTCWSSEDAQEGRRARAENRPPRFRGR
ncbi:MAG TPA: enoyl-CoA hydratase [Micromonosporaceae bacterium]|jgi:enoyl-CoA hydratase|nr:enoyl-CoA hydratase [Micromonosporaceae bacterium]